MNSMTGAAIQNFDERIFDICRCCLKNSSSKYISSEYWNSGQKEVYEKMIRNTFDVEITHYKVDNMTASRRICEECINLLREATAFKAMVLKNEKIFADQINTCLSGKKDGSVFSLQLPHFFKVADNKDHIDVEVKSEKSSHEDMDFEEHNFDSSDDKTLSYIKETLHEKYEFINIKEKKEDENNSDEMLAERGSPKKQAQSFDRISGEEVSRLVQRRGAGPVLRRDALRLLAHSSLCVFQWNQSRYRCFCCTQPFDDIRALREHNTLHDIHAIEKRIIAQQNKMVKVEISILFCKLCGEKIDDLKHLKSHLTEKHEVTFGAKEDLLVPFRIDGEFKCQICSERFNAFRLLNIHMNKHYQKQVCHICGAGFSNLVFLNLHKTRTHRPLKCKECGVCFKTKEEKNSHEVSVHGVKKRTRKFRFPCPYCSERFSQENFRVLHLVEKHGMRKPEYNCNACKKTFVTRSLLNNHVRFVHQKKRNHRCDVCHSLFYTNSDLTRHKDIHENEKKYSCSECDSSFGTKDALRRHTKKAH